MKKSLSYLSITALLIVLLTTCQKQIPSIFVSLEETTKTLEIGEKATLAVSVFSTNKTVRWSSSNPEVATVTDGFVKANSGGMVTALKSGTTTITVTTQDGMQTASCIVIVSPIKIEMVFVQGGTFTMGCTEDEGECEYGETPVHSVTLGNFHIGKYPVTQKQWKMIMEDNPSSFKNDEAPVENVSWNDVQVFIERLNAATDGNYRLPTEAEWEYAARGGSKGKNYKYSGSNTINEVAWYYENSSNSTHPVGGKLPNELGLYDMSGNVWEWCNDWYNLDYYAISPQNDPQGPATGAYRVLRGGAWLNPADACRVAYRNNENPDSRRNGVGFRLVSTF